MSIRRKSVLLIISVILTILIVLVFISRLFVIEGFLQLEDERMRRNLEHADYIINHELNNLDNLLWEWAKWDETYDFLQMPSESYVQRNLGLMTFTEMNVHFMIFINLEMEIIRIDHYDPASFLSTPPPEALVSMIESSAFQEQLREQEDKLFIISLDLPVFFAIQHVLTSDFDGPSTGWLAMGTYIDEAVSEKIANLLAGLPVTITRTEVLFAEQARIDPSALRSGPQIFIDGSNAMSGFKTLSNAFPQESLAITIHTQRPLYKKGVVTIHQFALFFSITLCLLGLAIYWVMDRWFLSKIAYQSRFLMEVRDSETLDKRIEVAGNDEIAHLSTEINNLLTSLKHRESIIRKNEYRLKQGEAIGHYGYFEWDLVGDDDYWSEELYRIFGEDVQSQGRTSSIFFRSVHPDDRDLLKEHLQKALKGDPYQIDHRIVLPSGEVRYLMEKAQAIFDSQGNPVRLAGTTQDVTDIKRTELALEEAKEETEAANQQLLAQNQELEKLYQRVQDLADRFERIILVSSKISEAALGKPDNFLKEVLELIVDFVENADYGSLSVFEGDKRRFVHAIGHDADRLRTLNLSVSDLAKIDQPKLIHDIMSENLPYMRPEIQNLMAEATLPIRSSIIMPLRIGEEAFGDISLDIAQHNHRSFTDDDVRIVESFGNIAASFLAMQQFMIQQGKFQKDLLMSMIQILELYDLYTKGHSENVAYLSALIAEKMHLSTKLINRIYWAGLVHDIGKLLVPTQVLNKESKLTPNEFEMIKMHPIWGAKVLQTSNQLEDVSKYVLYHHERFDGGGYPDGISDKTIPLPSRIISVADAFDAMTSERSYRKPLTIEDAREEVLKNAGSQFDPDVVRVFLELDHHQLRNHGGKES